MIEVKNLTVKTRHPILTDFSINFEKGKLYGIVAANGSRKKLFLEF